LKAAEMKESLVETLLCRIFGVLTVVRYPLRHGKDPEFVTNNQLLESVCLSTLCGRYQPSV